MATTDVHRVRVSGGPSPLLLPVVLFVVLFGVAVLQPRSRRAG